MFLISKAILLVFFQRTLGSPSAWIGSSWCTGYGLGCTSGPGGPQPRDTARQRPDSHRAGSRTYPPLRGRTALSRRGQCQVSVQLLQPVLLSAQRPFKARRDPHQGGQFLLFLVQQELQFLLPSEGPLQDSHRREAVHLYAVQQAVRPEGASSAAHSHPHQGTVSIKEKLPPVTYSNFHETRHVWVLSLVLRNPLWVSLKVSVKGTGLGLPWQGLSSLNPATRLLF